MTVILLAGRFFATVTLHCRHIAGGLCPRVGGFCPGGFCLGDSVRGDYVWFPNWHATVLEKKARLWILATDLRNKFS